MSRQQGYGVVDADDEFAGDISGHGQGNQLEFQTFLNTNDRTAQPSRIESDRQGQSPTVPFSIFNLTYYQSYFDVDTKTVLHRCLSSLVPREGFVDDTCEQRVDLYGPFWTLTTLILTIFLSTSLGTALFSPQPTSANNPSSTTSSSEKDLTLLTSITTLVYVYGLAFPAAFWALTRYFALKVGGNEVESGQGGGAAGWTLPEAWAIWGYGMVVWVPVSILCTIPIPILRWILVGAAGASSGYFLVRNVYPVLASIQDSKLPRTLILIVIIVHAVVTLTMKFVFFSYSVGGKKIGPDDPISDTIGDVVGGGGGGQDDPMEGEVGEMLKRWLGI